MKIYRKNELVRMENPTPGERGRQVILTEEQNAKAMGGHFSILPPGRMLPLHYHEKRESLIILVSGEAVEIAEGQEYVVQAGDVIYIPPIEKHKIENRSNQEVRYLEFFTPTKVDFIEVK